VDERYTVNRMPGPSCGALLLIRRALQPSTCLSRQLQLCGHGTNPHKLNMLGALPAFLAAQLGHQIMMKHMAAPPAATASQVGFGWQWGRFRMQLV
jgi:hypothetical protein